MSFGLSRAAKCSQLWAKIHFSSASYICNLVFVSRAIPSVHFYKLKSTAQNTRYREDGFIQLFGRSCTADLVECALHIQTRDNCRLIVTAAINTTYNRSFRSSNVERLPRNPRCSSPITSFWLRNCRRRFSNIFSKSLLVELSKLMVL